MGVSIIIFIVVGVGVVNLGGWGVVGVVRGIGWENLGLKGQGIGGWRDSFVGVMRGNSKDFDIGIGFGMDL